MNLDTFDDEGFVSLFDGSSLTGWHPAPRVYGTVRPGGPHLLDMFDERGIARPVEPEKHPAVWHVEDGYIVGEQEEPGCGYGGYLVSDDTFADFELVLEARPDWPADTGIMLRRKRDSWEGFQVLLDHRESGGIAGFFGNGLASFSAVPFAVVSEKDAQGRSIGLAADDPATSVEPVTQEKIDRLSYAADVNDFLRVWRWDDWNEIRIRCIGALPVITTWVNGLKIAELNTATLDSPDYDPAAVLDSLGNRGHLAFEVHDNDATFGEARWGTGAQCRWRSIRIKDLGETKVQA
ncbi:3-keto-disaccharide hydrolase [Streptomyces umbrinus]|uniref:3-keto-disaccharide hydrolase n=1 Tax=Streptomyces umbrinus TaxID=67370 RepID=UPI003415BB8A